MPDGSGIAAAIDYTLNRWVPLGRFIEDGNFSCHNNHLENFMRPWTMGRKAWLFAGSELAGNRAATVMSLVQSARMHDHDPWLYLRDVLTRLPTQPAREIDALLPHRWTPSSRGSRLTAGQPTSEAVVRTPAAGHLQSSMAGCFEEVRSGRQRLPPLTQ